MREEIAKAAAEGKTSLEDANFLVLPYGVMLYRLKQYTEAADVLGGLANQLSGPNDRESQYIRACAEYFLAMTRYQLGHQQPAQKLLHEAQATDWELRSDPTLKWTHAVVLNALPA